MNGLASNVNLFSCDVFLLPSVASVLVRFFCTSPCALDCRRRAHLPFNFCLHFGEDFSAVFCRVFLDDKTSVHLYQNLCRTSRRDDVSCSVCLLNGHPRLAVIWDIFRRKIRHDDMMNGRTGLPNVGAGMEMPSLLQGEASVIAQHPGAINTHITGMLDPAKRQAAFGIPALEHFSLCIGVRSCPLKV